MKVFAIYFYCFIFSSFSIFAQEEAPDSFIRGELLVKTAHSFSIEEAVNELSEQTGLSIRIKKNIAPLWDIFLLEIPKGYEQEILKMAKQTARIETAQLNHIAQSRGVAPNDVNYPSQWALNNTGQNNGTPMADIDAERAWAFSQGGVTADGDTIVVAILDDGMNLFHEDLIENVWRNIHEIPNNQIDDDNNGFIDDYNGWNIDNDTSFIASKLHGSAVAGVIGAQGNNTKGISGVNWHVKLMPIQVNALTDDRVTAAYYYAYVMRKKYNQTQGNEGAFIVATNASFGVDLGNPDDFPLWCSIYDSLGQLGILNVAATTNQALDVDQRGDVPTACKSDFLIAVTEIARTDIFPFSGYGAINVDLAAPGIDIFSTITGNAYLFVDGTSFASPHVAGVVALLYAAACDSFIFQYKNQPQSTALQVKKFILDATDPTPALKDKVLTEGRLNAYRSILELKSQYCNSCPLGVQVSKINPSCFGIDDGAIQISAQGGTPPYEYDSRGRKNTALMDSLAPGTIKVFVIDANQCVQSESLQLIAPPPFVAGILTLTDSISTQILELQAQVLSGGEAPFTYIWNDTLVATLPSIHVSGKEGLYSLIIIDANGCEAASSFNVPLFTGVDDFLSKNNIQIIPNPASNQVWIKNSDPRHFPLSIVITDMQGKKLIALKQTHESHVIDISSLPNGVYILNLVGNEMNHYFKIIKQN